MSDIALRKFFGFDESDLTSNRHGRLSKKQEQTIRSAESGANRVFVFAGVVFISLAFGSTFGILKAARDAGVTFTSVSDLIGPLIGLALIWGLLGFLAIGSFQLAKSKLDSSVQKVEGEVHFVKVEKQVANSAPNAQKYRTVQQYELRVDRIAFHDVNEELLNIISDGDTYAFYYTKDTKKILSCEFIAKGK